MKTAAALVICLGLGCAAAGLPGDAAAGQPLEKRLGQPLDDCVSFIGKAECESMYYIWSDVIGNCPHSASALKSDSAPASGPALLTTVLAAAAAAL